MIRYLEIESVNLSGMRDNSKYFYMESNNYYVYKHINICIYNLILDYIHIRITTEFFYIKRII